MVASKRMPRRTLREFVRRLFAYRLLVLACATTGLAAGFLHAWKQPRTFAGFLELAAGATTSGPAAVRLPDAVQLRRMLLEPRVVRALLPEDAEGLDAEEPPGVVELQRKIQVVPVATAIGADRSVYRVSMEIPAADWQAARQQMRVFADRLQSEFEGAGVVRRRSLGKDQIAIDDAIVAVGHIDWNDDLEARARELGTTIEHAQQRLEQLRQELSSKSAAMAELERHSAERMAGAARLEAERSLAKIPRRILEGHPQALDAATRQEDAARKLAAVAAKATPSHPSYMAAKRNLDQAKLAAEQAAVALAAQWSDEARNANDELRERQKDIDDRRAVMVKLERLLRDKTAGEPKPKPPSKSAEPVNNSTGHPSGPQANLPPRTETPNVGPRMETVPPTTLQLTPSPNSAHSQMPAAKPGKLLVAGPFVEQTAVRPRWLHDIGFGLLFGSIAGLLVAVVRGGADQRVRSQGDIDDLQLGIEVFGSIPQLENAAPVRIVRSASGDV